VEANVETTILPKSLALHPLITFKLERDLATWVINREYPSCRRPV
jgi:hypothetical protein